MSNIAEALAMWNDAAKECGWPQVIRLTSDRERKLRNLVSSGLEDWTAALAKARASDFLCGRTERIAQHASWRFTFDAMVRESFFVKLLEGNYDNARPSTIAVVDPETSLWSARLRDYKPGGFWHFGWGPRPEGDGCHAPRAVLEQWQQQQKPH